MIAAEQIKYCSIYSCVCLYGIQNTMLPPWNKTIHHEGMEITENITEKCDNKARQKQLLLAQVKL
jgi:hypothetical protein